eukprot:4335077-Prorocentrum_lima.AAC.1
MTSSLVGSEMCIRDRLLAMDLFLHCLPLQYPSAIHSVLGFTSGGLPEAVSYTHLTLPTICSV